MLTGKVKGFTFIEMIVAIVITAFLGAAIYTTFAQGIRLWTRTSGDRGEWKVDLWGERLIGDLRNAFWDPQWPFRGTRTELFFATLTHEGIGARVPPAPVYLHYTFDPKTGVVASRKHAFEEALAAAQRSPRASDSVLDRVVSFGLEYYTYDAKAKDYRWVSRWNKDCFPETVKITIETKQMNHRKWIRRIQMPMGSACPE